MKCGYLTYKCRMCGKTFEPVHAPDVIVALVEATLGTNMPKTYDKIRASATELHSCENGGIGIADLIGGKHDN